MYRKTILLFMLSFLMVVSSAQDGALQEDISDAQSIQEDISDAQAMLEALERLNAELQMQLEVYEQQIIDKQAIIESLQIEIDALKQSAE